MRIGVTGATGFIGSALIKRLAESNHDAIAFTRSEGKVQTASQTRQWDPSAAHLSPTLFEDLDVLVHLAGVSIAQRRWNHKQKAALVSSRVQPTARIASSLAQLSQAPRLISASAVGFYGDTGETETDESSPQGNDFLANLCAKWEAATHEAGPSNVVQIRSGVVLHPSGGLLKRQLLPFKLGIGGRVGTGKQWIPWIALNDHLTAIEFLAADSSVVGPINLVAPSPVRQLEFAQTLASHLHRRAFLPTPISALKMVFGAELVDALMLASQRIVPTRLQELGFAWAAPTFKEFCQQTL